MAAPCVVICERRDEVDALGALLSGLLAPGRALHVIVRVPQPHPRWPVRFANWEALASALDEGERQLDRLTRALAGSPSSGAALSGEVLLDHEGDALAERVAALEPAWVLLSPGATGGQGARLAPELLSALAPRLSCPIGWRVGGLKGASGPARAQALCPYDRPAALAPAVAWLGERRRHGLRVPRTLVAVALGADASPEEVQRVRDTLGGEEALVHERLPHPTPLLPALLGLARRRRAALILLPAHLLPSHLARWSAVAGAHWAREGAGASGEGVELWLLPSSGPARRVEGADALLEPGGGLFLQLDQTSPEGEGGRPWAYLSAEGRGLGRLEFDAEGVADGLVHLEGAAPLALGITLASRDDGAPGPNPARLDASVPVVALAGVRVSLVDVELPLATLRTLSEALSRAGESLGGERLVLALRVERRCSFSWMRARLREAGLSAAVGDAACLLRDGAPGDRPGHTEALRLARVARHLRALGVAVDSAFGVPGPPGLDHRGFASVEGTAALEGAELARRISEAWRPPRSDGTLATLIGELCGGARYGGNRVSVELDNAYARQQLITLIRRAEERVLLATYIADDHPAVREVEAELVAAAARGVRVHVLVDAVVARIHGAGLLSNPLLERLAGVPGISVRASRSLRGHPGVRELKRRDHRKIFSVDGRWALIGGRNLGEEYLRGLDEAALRVDTPLAEIPWIDGGALIEGPAVGGIDAVFREAWGASDPWDRGGPARAEVSSLQPPAPLGDAVISLVTHRSLCDTHTLDLWRALIGRARERVSLVNTFPISGALERALAEAAGRGVEVNIVFGCVQPRNDRGEPVGASPSWGRRLADTIIYGRVVRLVRRGARGWLVRAPRGRRWAPELEVLRPHVHAKLLSVDGRWCTVGSANADITSAYWESELVALVDDPQASARVDALIESLIADAAPVSAAWRDEAPARAWLSAHWPSLLG